MTTWGRAVLVLLLLMVLTVVVPESLRQFKASALHVPLQQQIRNWVQGHPPTADQWQAALQDARLASQLQPTMAEYQLTLSKVIEWGWYLQYASADDVATLPAIYTNAIQLRPLWAQAYADAAWYWFFIGNNIQQSRTLLLRAYQLGAYTPEVLFRGLTIELRQWPALSVQEKKAALQRLQRLYGTELQPRLVQLVALNQKQRPVCLYLRNQPNLSVQQQRQVFNHFCKG